MAQESKTTNNIPENGAVKSAPAASTAIKDDTVISVKALVPNVFYTCDKTYDSFAWFEVGDLQEMTYQQLKTMKAKHPRYFTEKWLVPCSDDVIKKLGLTDIYKRAFKTADMRLLYDGTNLKEIEDLLSGLTDTAIAGLTQNVVKAVKNGKIDKVQVIRLLEKKLGIELMQYA